MKNKIMLSVLMIVLMIVSVSAVSAATISTDKDDYSPGEIVLISGSGFNADAPLTVSVTRPDLAVETCSVASCNIRFLDGAIAADSSGEFAAYQYDLNGIEGTYTVDVSDGTNTATMTFTDGISDLDLYVPESSGIVWSGTNNINFYVNEYSGGGTVYIFYSDDGCHGTSLPSSTSGDSTWTLIGNPYYNSDGTKNFAWDTTTVPDGTNYCILIWDGYTSSYSRDDDRSNNVFEIDNGDSEVEITVVAHKIVCDSESDLPNWGGGGASITSSTATDYVANNQNCHLQSGWDFQWRFGGSNPGDNNDCVGSGWTTFGSSTDGNGMTSTTIDNADSDTLWFRECLKSGYVQFSDSLGDDNTAEFYCNGDVLNYDNYDNINDAISNGDTFYCVAFNAELECVEDSDCAPDNNYCDGSFWVHYSESCVDNECLPASSTADCNDGLFCNGEETCTGEAVCVPGTDPCDDGDVCEDTCDDDQDTCTYDVDDITGPETDGMTIDPVYNNGNFELDATSEDECSYVASAEYFVGQGTAFCGDDGTGYAMDAVDASFDELLEEIWEDHVNSPVTIQDGQNFVCIKAKDSLGNLGNCACKYFESDTIPPERVFDIFLNGVENPDELLICDNDPTLCLTICDSESDIQGGEYFLNMLIPPEDIPAPWSGYWLESCIQYMDVGWHCADLTATIPIDGSAEGIVDNGDGNFEPAHPVLAEGTHYINQIRGKDIVENWGKIWNQNFGYSFIIDREAPIITKELLPVDDLAFSCQWTEMMGHQLTHGCQYVKSGTQVHLSADDSTFVDDHEFAGDVIIYYKVYWSYDGSSWELVQEEQSGVDQELYITLSEDSFHLVEFWAVDGCGHETEHYFELDVVDTLEPVGIKTIGAPNISCESMGDPECDYWVRDHVTEITLDCVDQDPHPVGGEILYYKISFDDPQTPWLTRDYCAAFGGTFVPEGQGTDGWCVVGVSDGSYTFVFTEDSLHDLEFYCEDALGNANQVDLEYFKVDSVPPTTTKTYGEPYFADPFCLAFYEDVCLDWEFMQGDFESYEDCITSMTHMYCTQWITSDTSVTLESEDGGEICAVGNETIYWRNLWFPDNDEICYRPAPMLNGDGINFCHPEYYLQKPHVATPIEGFNEYIIPFYKPEESCHVIEYYSVDALGNEEPLQWQCVFVDNSEPIIEKHVDEPKIKINPDCNPEVEICDYWITDESVIKLDCIDAIPHPVNDVTLYYRWNLDGGDWNGWYDTDGHAEIQFGEDSNHTIQWYCEDALGNSAGTEQDPFEELDIVDTAPPEITKFVIIDGERFYAPEEGVETIAVQSGEVLKFCADVVDYKKTCDLGVGVWDVWARFSELDDPEMLWDETEQAYCYERTVPEECGKWHFEVRARDLLDNQGPWTDGIEIIIDNVPPFGVVLNPHAGNNYYAGKIFPFYAPAVDFGGNTGECDCGACSSQDCPASGVDYCDIYAIDYPFADIDQSEIKDCYQDLLKWMLQTGVISDIPTVCNIPDFGMPILGGVLNSACYEALMQEIMDPTDSGNVYLEYIGHVPYNDGVCQGYLTIPENTNLTDTVFMAWSVVDNAGNGDGVIRLALNPWDSDTSLISGMVCDPWQHGTPITMNIEEKGDLMVTPTFKDPLTSGDELTVTAEVSAELIDSVLSVKAEMYSYIDNETINFSDQEADDYCLFEFNADTMSYDPCYLDPEVPGYEKIESGVYAYEITYMINGIPAEKQLFSFIVDNDRPYMGVITPHEGGVYSDIMPVSMVLNDDYSNIADETVMVRIHEKGKWSNGWCLVPGTCEDTGWVPLIYRYDDLYSKVINLLDYGIEGEGEYMFDAVACDTLYDPAEDSNDGLGFVMDSRNQHHCRMISELGHGAEEIDRPECNDGWDNDGDEAIDYFLEDPGCESSEDDLEENFCGDGTVDLDEECDDNGANGVECIPEYDGDCTYCTLTCTEETLFGDFCGDGVVNGPEVCEEDTDCGTGFYCDACECFEEEPEPESVCNDGIDNDQDGYIDCDDSECFEDPFCID